jgi:hypothetical protein
MNSISKRSADPLVFLTDVDLAQLGDGEVAYIKELTLEEASRLFPTLTGVPSGIALFVLQGADGSPIALTDSREAAVAHAFGDDLKVASVH